MIKYKTQVSKVKLWYNKGMYHIEMCQNYVFRNMQEVIENHWVWAQERDYDNESDRRHKNVVIRTALYTRRTYKLTRSATGCPSVSVHARISRGCARSTRILAYSHMRGRDGEKKNYYLISATYLRVFVYNLCVTVDVSHCV